MSVSNSYEGRATIAPWLVKLLVAAFITLTLTLSGWIFNGQATQDNTITECKAKILATEKMVDAQTMQLSRIETKVDALIISRLKEK